MDLLVQEASPQDTDLSVYSHGWHYAVNAAGPQGRWNREAVKLLFQLFRMTATEIPRRDPPITIAK
ncbi:MAG: hypothetical protein NTNFB02_05880 [Nitrospira sp.]